MRKTFRIIYLLLMPILFVALLAVCFSFSGTMTMSTAANNSGTSVLDPSIAVQADCIINLNGFVFTVENFVATLDKTFKYSLTGLTDVTSGNPITLGENAKITLQALSLIGLGVFAVGFFLSEVGYGSKVATILGALILVGGSVCIFMNTELNEGLHYVLNIHTVQDGEEIVKEVVNFKLDWLTIKLVAGIADGLTVLNVLFVLTKKKEA